MPHQALLLFRVLASAEPFLTVAALGAFLRVRREVDMPAMRDYLLVRTVCVLLLDVILLKFSTHNIELYFFSFWAGWFLLAMLLMRVAMASLDRFLWSFRGLGALRAIGYRWFLIAALILTVPILITLASAIVHRTEHAAGWWSLRLGGAVGLVEVLAVTSVLIVGLRAGLSPRSRVFGILVGLAMEPAADVVLPFFASYGLWTWNNLIRQIVTDSALTLWIVYLLLPDRRGPMNEPSERVLRWDQVARWVMRDQLPPEPEEPLAEVRQHEAKEPE
jgi:hypothetical protein